MAKDKKAASVKPEPKIMAAYGQCTVSITEHNTSLLHVAGNMMASMFFDVKKAEECRSKYIRLRDTGKDTVCLCFGDALISMYSDRFKAGCGLKWLWLLESVPHGIYELVIEPDCDFLRSVLVHGQPSVLGSSVPLTGPACNLVLNIKNNDNIEIINATNSASKHATVVVSHSQLKHDDKKEGFGKIWSASKHATVVVSHSQLKHDDKKEGFGKIWKLARGVIMARSGPDEVKYIKRMARLCAVNHYAMDVMYYLPYSISKAIIPMAKEIKKEALARAAERNKAITRELFSVLAEVVNEEKMPMPMLLHAIHPMMLREVIRKASPETAAVLKKNMSMLHSGYCAGL